MIRLGLRLTLNGGREAAVRLVVTAVAVALGVGMLLITLAGINAVNTQNGRYAWLETGAVPHSSDPRAGVDPAWWLLTGDQFHGKIIGRVDVAATGPHSPVPPGIAHLPSPGQFYASPAMTALLRTTPTAELGARYPGKQLGTIGTAALPAADSLLIVIGRTPHELAAIADATQVTRISTTNPSSCNGDCYFIGIDANGIDLVLGVTSAALLFPVLIFIGTATRLSATRREQRFAAMRLVGATPGQVSIISAVESTVAAVAGVGLGFAVFGLLRPALATIPFTGTRFVLSDLSLNLADTLTVALGVPLAAAIAARLALRRVTISPLGVTRRVRRRPPGAWRLIPLVAGICELAYFVSAGRPKTTPGQIEAYLSGILIVMAGLVIAGPWLIMFGARVMAARARRPATLIAARRLADNPYAGFRAISGLVLALFVTSVAIGVITTIKFYDGGPATSTAAKHTLVDNFFRALGPNHWSTTIPSLPAGLLRDLHAIPGVQGVTEVREDPNSTEPFPPGVASCADLARTPALGRCARGASTVEITPSFGGRDATSDSSSWPASQVTADELAALPVQSIAIATTGPAAVERARSTFDLAFPHEFSVQTIAEETAQAGNRKLTTAYEQLVNVIVLASLPIAGCSLAVSVAGGLSDRKRPFSLLRLTGAPLGMLRRVVALESAVPLIAIAMLSTAAGLLTAGLFVRSQLSETLHPPGAQYYLIVAAGLVASLAIIASTLPLLERITGAETARNE